MRNLPVHWSEGMFLRPQHFQAAERYWSEALHTSQRWDHEFNYGLRRIDFSEEAIRNFEFRLHACEARLPDGTLISIAPGQQGPDALDLREPFVGLQQALESPALDLKAAFAAQANVRVYLAVPRLKLGSPNVGMPGEPGVHRYSTVQESVEDEALPGAPQPIALRTLNVKLLLSTQDRAGYECLPIAELQRVDPATGVPGLNRDYVPPLLAIDAWPPLWRDIVQYVRDYTGKKVDEFSQVVRDLQTTWTSHEFDDLNRLMMLRELNEQYAVLSVLAFAAGVHPLPAYLEFCRFVGKLSVFDDSRRAPQVPRYDHDNLGYIFGWVKQRIVQLIDKVHRPVYEVRPFVGINYGPEQVGMHVELDPKWLLPGWKWYVGVSRSVSEQECDALLARIAWKLASRGEVSDVFEKRMAGLGLTRTAEVPNVLPRRPDLTYYRVTQDGERWRRVVEEKTLGLRFNRDNVENRHTLEGQQRLILDMRNGRGQVTLEFALYAVPEKL